MWRRGISEVAVRAGGNGRDDCGCSCEGMLHCIALRGS